MKTSKIRQSARGEQCTFQIPGVCNHDPETVTLCHAPHPDKGMGFKGPDSWSAYGCSDCHAEMDGRTGEYFGTLGSGLEYHGVFPADLAALTGEFKKSIWFDAIRETQRRLIAKGLMPK